MVWIAVFIPIIILQVVLASVVIFFLMKTLNRNLVEMGVIRLENWQFERRDVKVSKVDVLTSKSLAQAFQTRIQEAVAKYFGPNTPITFNVSKDLLGGIVIKMDQEMIDCSTRNRLVESGLFKR